MAGNSRLLKVFSAALATDRLLQPTAEGSPAYSCPTSTSDIAEKIKTAISEEIPSPDERYILAIEGMTLFHLLGINVKLHDFCVATRPYLMQPETTLARAQELLDRDSQKKKRSNPRVWAELTKDLGLVGEDAQARLAAEEIMDAEALAKRLHEWKKAAKAQAKLKAAKQEAAKPSTPKENVVRMDSYRKAFRGPRRPSDQGGQVTPRQSLDRSSALTH